MPPGEAAVLGYLDRGGPLTTAEIAQQRGVSHQSAAKTVKDLLAQDLVRAEAPPRRRAQTPAPPHTGGT